VTNSHASSPAQLPDEKTRLRCGHCGNLTRFDITRTVRSADFWHANLAGDVEVEESVVLAEEVESIRCRWCSSSDRIEVVPRPEFGGPDREAAGDGGV
jgi:DNA-directed RNA polymerase subunit RPC12/RpoP